jgi:hypothetical protein
VVVVESEFGSLAKHQAALSGVPDLPLVMLPRISASKSLDDMHGRVVELMPRLIEAVWR